MTTPQDTQPPGGATLQEAYEATALRSKTSDPIGDYHKLLVASVSAVIPRRTREHAQSVLDEIWTLARALHAAYARGREDVAVKWTRTSPTVPGWYWHRFVGMTAGRREPRIFEIVKFEERNGVRSAIGSSANPMPFVDCEEWAGPVAHPDAIRAGGA